MKVCIYGTGAVGGYVAAMLGHHGAGQVSVIARGAQKAAIEASGLRLETPSGSITYRPTAITDNPFSLPPQDMVFVSLKVMSQPAAAAGIGHLLGEHGWAVFAANGLPWWWKHGTSAPAHLPLLDPDAALWNTVRPERALGCVVYSANEVIAPGVVRHLGNNRWVIGEPAGEVTERVRRTVALLQAGGINGDPSPNLRLEIWAKLLRNTSINSLCALTRLPVDGLAEDPELLAQAEALVNDVVAIAAAQGCDLSQEREAAFRQLRRGGAEGNGPPVKGLRPSMLQDALAGRALEVEAIVGQPQALAREAGVPCPAIDAVLPVLRGLDRSLRRKD